jgi:hypothetical protein
MKRNLLVLFFSATIIAGYSQKEEPVKEKNLLKFHLGINYNYMNDDMELTYMSFHSVWKGEDLGTETLSDQQIDTINDFMKFTNSLNAISVEMGLSLLNRPDVNWKIDGRITFGTSKTHRSAYNKNSSSTEQDFESDFVRPYFGLGFDFRYVFTPNWSLLMAPSVAYSWGVSNKIDDYLYPPAENYDETRKEVFKSVYSRFNLLASYTVWHITLSAGPGFYYYYNDHDYKIERTNLEDGSVITDDITTRFHNKSFFDGCLTAQWRIIDALAVDATCAIGNDILVHAGIRYTFN